MTNFEYYKDEIKKIADTGRFIALHNRTIVACRSIRCEDCEFEDRLASMFSSDCHKYMLQWLCKECERKQKLTVWEYNYLLLFKKGYMLRNIDAFGDDILIYRDKPVLSRGLTSEWHASELKASITNAYRVFNFIKAGDEPYSIEEMLTWEHEVEHEVE